jgi:hypothetical protein
MPGGVHGLAGPCRALPGLAGSAFARDHHGAHAELVQVVVNTGFAVATVGGDRARAARGPLAHHDDDVIENRAALHHSAILVIGSARRIAVAGGPRPHTAGGLPPGRSR